MKKNDNNKMCNPIVVQFPLRGEWHSPNTPGSKIPSHGTNQFGTRYAYDFLQVDWKRMGWPAYKVSFAHYLLMGVPMEKYYCWGQQIYSPCDGIVIKSEDGLSERNRTRLFSDMNNARKNAHFFNPLIDNPQVLAGNYIIIKFKDNIYAALCHLQTDSIQVSVGQNVKKGDFIGKVGHTGNSYAPHLHFQLMDSPNLAIANGIPCAFEQYDVLRNGVWVNVKNGIPTKTDRIRFGNGESY